jgi:hypothetical protein
MLERQNDIDYGRSNKRKRKRGDCYIPYCGLLLCFCFMEQLVKVSG